MMMKIAMGILRQTQDAEDAIQNSLIAMARHMDAIEQPEDIRTVSYVRTVVRNAAIDIYRKKERKNISYDDLLIEPADTFNLEKVVCDSEEVRRVIKAIEQMETEYREVLSLFYLNEMSPREIADVLNRPYNTVRSQINRGRKKLLKLL